VRSSVRAARPYAQGVWDGKAAARRLADVLTAFDFQETGAGAGFAPTSLVVLLARRPAALAGSEGLRRVLQRYAQERVQLCWVPCDPDMDTAAMAAGESDAVAHTAAVKALGGTALPLAFLVYLPALVPFASLLAAAGALTNKLVGPWVTSTATSALPLR
jgi:hypothetical protein